METQAALKLENLKRNLTPEEQARLQEAFEAGIEDEKATRRYSPWGIPIKYDGIYYDAYSLGWNHAAEVNATFWRVTHWFYRHCRTIG